MRNRFPVAVHLFFFHNQQVLLLRRFNTGYEDGNYSLVAGHVEAEETVTQAAIREASEEVGVSLAPEDVEVVHVMNRKAEDERIDFFLAIKRWTGEITNKERHKCDELTWFPVAFLPDNIIPYVRSALESYQKGLLFSEYGWQVER